MNILFIVLFAIYIVIVFLAGGKVLCDYHVRQLVKANFWCNVAIFALLALLTLIILIEFYVGQ
jgi:hypothetical protein